MVGKCLTTGNYFQAFDFTQQEGGEEEKVEGIPAAAAMAPVSAVVIGNDAEPISGQKRSAAMEEAEAGEGMGVGNGGEEAGKRARGVI